MVVEACLLVSFAVCVASVAFTLKTVYDLLNAMHERLSHHEEILCDIRESGKEDTWKL